MPCIALGRRACSWGVGHACKQDTLRTQVSPDFLLIRFCKSTVSRLQDVSAEEHKQCIVVCGGQCYMLQLFHTSHLEELQRITDECCKKYAFLRRSPIFVGAFQPGTGPLHKLESQCKVCVLLCLLSLLAFLHCALTACIVVHISCLHLTVTDSAFARCRGSGQDAAPAS